VARFGQPFIDRVLQATDVVDLVSQHVALKKQGREFVGLCPFHEDHRPSMHVSPAKQIFKCFVCGAGGSAIQFLMQYEKLSFPEAVRALAERAHIAAPDDAEAGPRGDGLGKDELRNVTTWAARFYREQLQGPAGRAALDYARGRGLSDESIRRFGLGYAPDAWEALLTAGRKQGYSDRQLEAAGLVRRRDEGAGCYDRFRNRLLFPILDGMGRVIGFGGRALADDEPAKYLNSPQTPLFDKSAQLYALNWARDAIVSTGTAVVVEGYLDALIPLQAGVGNVVATLGTALTDQHVRLLGRYAREAVLVFDADAAGAAAAERALEVFLAQQVHVRVATVPAGKDPCDYCLAEGPEALRAVVDEAPDALEHVWRQRLAAVQRAGGNLADRRRLIEEFLTLVVSSAAYGAIDGVRRGQLAQHIAHLLNVPAGDLEAQMRRLGRRVRTRARVQGPGGSADEPRPGGGGTDAPLAAPVPPAERHVLEVLLARPDLFEAAAEKIDPGAFGDAELRAVAEVVWSLGAAGRLGLEAVLSTGALASRGTLVTDLFLEGQRRGNEEATLAGAVADILYRREKQELRALRSGEYSDESLRALGRGFQRPDPRRVGRIE